ncbi:MAG TPA: glycosyltransferase family 2 protein [Armatimonadota bacterium]|jgi:GT2 family glycosyltransferase
MTAAATPATVPLSVVILTYKRPEELAGALESVLAQDVPPDEIIIYDDDPAGSARQVAPEGDTRIRYVCIGQNLGPAGARARAVAETRGELLLFIDDDCRFATPTVSATVLELFQTQTIGLGVFLVRNAFTGKIDPKEYPGYSTQLWEEPHAVSYFVASGFAVRRTAYDAVGGFDGVLYHGEEELDLSFRLVNAGWTLWYSPELAVDHRVSPLGRDTIQRVYQLTRNRIYLAVKHLPCPFMLSHLLLWGGFITLKALRQRQLAELARGLRSLWRDGLWGQAWRYRRAHPMTRQAYQYLREHEGRLLY